LRGYASKKVSYRKLFKKAKKAGHRRFLSTNDVRVLNSLERSYEERIKLPFQLMDRDVQGNPVSTNYLFSKLPGAYGGFGCFCLSELFKKADVGKVGKVKWTGIKVNLHLSNIVSTTNGIQNPYSGDLSVRVVVFRSKKFVGYTHEETAGVNPLATKMGVIADPDMFETPVSSYTTAEFEKKEIEVIKTFTTKMPAGKVATRRYPIWIPYRKEFRFLSDESVHFLTGYYHNFYFAVFVDDVFCNPVDRKGVVLGQMKVDGFNYYSRCISSKPEDNMTE